MKEVPFDPKPLEDLGLDPFEIGMAAAPNGRNPYKKGTLGYQAFERGKRYVKEGCP